MMSLKEIVDKPFETGIEIAIMGRLITEARWQHQPEEELKLHLLREGLERQATLRYDADQWEQFRAGLLEGRNRNAKYVYNTP